MSSATEWSDPPTGVCSRGRFEESFRLSNILHRRLHLLIHASATAEGSGTEN